MEFVNYEFCDTVLAGLSRVDINVATRFAAFSWSQSAAETLCKLKNFKFYVKTDPSGNVSQRVTQRLDQREIKSSMQEYHAVDAHFRRITAITIDVDNLCPEETQLECLGSIQRSLMPTRTEWDSPALNLKINDLLQSHQFQFFGHQTALFGELTLRCPKFFDSIETFLRLQVNEGALRKLTLLGVWPKLVNISEIVEPLIGQKQLELLNTATAEGIAFDVQPFKRLLDRWIDDPVHYSSYSQSENTVAEQRNLRAIVNFHGEELRSHLTLKTRGFSFVTKLERSDPRTGCSVKVSSYVKYCSPTFILNMTFENENVEGCEL